MAKFYDLARMYSATTGTGTITLGAAVPPFLSFSAAGVADGDVVAYSILDGANSEIGTGTYTAAGTTLSRTVTKSTNSNTAISLSGGAQVMIAARAEDVANLGEPNSFTKRLTVAVAADIPAIVAMDDFTYAEFAANFAQHNCGIEFTPRDNSNAFYSGGFIIGHGGASTSLEFISPGTNNGPFIFGIGNGAGGSTQALSLNTDTSATFANYVATGTVTVASLPAAAAGNKAARYMVSDATATTFWTIVAGGGANIVPVTSDGTNWRIG